MLIQWISGGGLGGGISKGGGTGFIPLKLRQTYIVLKKLIKIQGCSSYIM
jgi:hypothetical protein